MFRSTRVQMLLVLVAGAAVGYGAASGKLNPFQSAEAASPGGASVSEKTGGGQSGDCSGCCGDGANKSQLLAMADPKVK